MDEAELIDLTAEIVKGYVTRNPTAISDLPNLIASTHAALAALGQAVQPEPEATAPAVSVRSSVKPDAITCLICGSKQKMLKRHLMTAHGIEPSEYRRQFALPASYPLVAPNYSKQRAELARKIGLGTKGARLQRRK